MSGLQLADPQVKKQLGLAERRGIAETLGENLAQMQQLTWPITGCYNAAHDTVEPFELASELALPFPPEAHAQLASREPILVPRETIGGILWIMYLETL